MGVSGKANSSLSACPEILETGVIALFPRKILQSPSRCRFLKQSIGAAAFPSGFTFFCRRFFQVDLGVYSQRWGSWPLGPK